MKRTTILLATLQVLRLQEESKRTGLATAEIIRRAIDEYLERQRWQQLEVAIEDEANKPKLTS